MIVSAAVKIVTHDGQEHIIPCHRHGDVFRICAMFNIERNRVMDVQGFIARYPINDDPFNYHEQFMTRSQAMNHALMCGQVKEEDVSDHPNELYSEDLW